MNTDPKKSKDAGTFKQLGRDLWKGWGSTIEFFPDGTHKITRHRAPRNIEMRATFVKKRPKKS